MLHNIIMRILLTLFRRRDIVIDGNLYLRRFFLTPRSWRWRIFLHRIYRSDPDRALHDHPWDFTTLILRGGYQEVLPGIGMFRYARPGTLLRNKAEHTHRVILNKPTWSLLLVGRARRMWGFWREESSRRPGDGPWATWVDWRTYLGLPDETDQPEDKVETR